MKILYGKPVADSIYKSMEQILNQLEHNKIQPHLAVIMIGNDPVSEKYVDTKVKTMKKVGLEISIYRLKPESTLSEVKELIDYLNSDIQINGILVQLPLPNSLKIDDIKKLINKEKDVDGFLMQEYKAPAPQAIIDLLDYYKIPIKDENVLLVGYGTLVGQPVNLLLKERQAKVSISTNSTADLAQKISLAKIIISAVGQPKLITADLVKKDQIYIDAGTASEGNTTVGDIDFDEVSPIVEAISPVPGGVGPITVAELFRNVVLATMAQNKMNE
jgi:methylenetetrahydrofolate dehydrogenase (NADP+)/methenyltetrahydrofolate cyclohydrolase